MENEKYCLIHILPINIVKNSLSAADMSKLVNKKEIGLIVPRDDITKLRIPLPNCTIPKFQEYMALDDEILRNLQELRLRSEQQTAQRIISKCSKDNAVTKSEESSPKKRQLLAIFDDDLEKFLNEFASAVRKWAEVIIYYLIK